MKRPPVLQGWLLPHPSLRNNRYSVDAHLRCQGRLRRWQFKKNTHRNCAQLVIFVCETVPNSMSSPPVPKLCLTLHSALYLTVPNAIQDSRYAQSKILPGNSPWSLAKRHLNEPRLRSMRGHIVKRETCRSSRRRCQPRNVVCFHHCSYVF